MMLRPPLSTPTAPLFPYTTLFLSNGLLAQIAGSSITATNTAVTTSGSDSYGANAYNGGALVLNTVAVKTSGARAHGLVMGGMSDTMRPGSDGRIPDVASSIVMTGGSVVATGAEIGRAHV